MWRGPVCVRRLCSIVFSSVVSTTHEGVACSNMALWCFRSGLRCCAQRTTGSMTQVYIHCCLAPVHSMRRAHGSFCDSPRTAFVRGGLQAMSDEEDWLLAGRGPAPPAAMSDRQVIGDAPPSPASHPLTLAVPPIATESPVTDESEEDWAGADGGPLGKHVAPSSPPQAIADERPARTFDIVRGRIMKRPASALSVAAPLNEPQGADLSVLVGVPKLARFMFGPRASGAPESLLLSHQAMAHECGIPPSSFQRELCGLALSGYKRLKANVAEFVGRCLSPVGVSGVGEQKSLLQPLLFVRWRKYDETPLKLKVKIQAGKNSHACEGTEGQQKLFVIEAGWGMCFRRIQGSEAKLLAITGDQPTTLTVVEKNTAECIKKALEQLRMPYDDKVDSTFFRCIDLSMTDECAANLRCERLLLGTRTGQRQSLLHLSCDAHKIATIHTNTFALLRPWDSRVIRLALSVDGMGVQRLRKELRLIIEEQLVVMYGARPKVDASRHRQGVFDLFITRSSPRERYRKNVLEGLFNGDIRKLGVVEHFEYGCCASRQHTLAQMVEEGVRCLVPARFHVLSRSNWTGADRAIESIGLPAGVHGLLAQAYCRAFPSSEFGDAQVTGRGVMSSVASASGTPGGPVGSGGGGGAATDAPEPNAAGEEQPHDVSIWREEAHSRISQTRQWLSSDAFRDDMTIAQLLYRPQSLRMLRQLSTTGESWQREQQQAYIQTGTREYQICLAASGDDDFKLMGAMSQLAMDCGQWSMLQQRSEDVCLLLFKSVSRSGALALDLLERRHRYWPFKLFLLLGADREVVATQLADAPGCSLDAFTLGFRERYCESGLVGELAIAELRLLAALCVTDTASTERWHSRNQRHSRSRVWTHSYGLPALSAHFVGKRSRGSPLPTDPAESGGKRRRKASAIQSAREEQASTQRSGAGGAWRAFLHIQAAGMKFTPSVITELSQKYQALGEEEWQYYNEVGILATIAHRQGELAFGRRVRNRPMVMTPLSDGVSAGHGGAAGSASDSQAPAEERLQLVPVAQPDNARVLRDARAAKKEAKVEGDMEQSDAQVALQARSRPAPCPACVPPN